jgi:hypothetical protein
MPPAYCFEFEVRSAAQFTFGIRSGTVREVVAMVDECLSLPLGVRDRAAGW